MIRKQLPIDTPLYLTKELEQYVQFSFRQQIIDFYKSESKGRFEFKEYPVKQCKQEDFGYGKQDIINFESWAGFSLICPDFKPGEGLVLEGEPASMI